MGNGVSGSQGNLPSRGKRDVSTSIVKAQHDWQEQAVAPKQETLSLPDARNAYSIISLLQIFCTISYTQRRRTCECEQRNKRVDYRLDSSVQQIHNKSR